MPEPLSIRDRVARYVASLPAGMRVTSRDLSRVMNCSADSASYALKHLAADGHVVEVTAVGAPTSGAGALRIYQVATRTPRPDAAPEPAPGDTLASVARQFVAYWRRDGGCGMCGGSIHSTTCFVGRIEALLPPEPTTAHPPALDFGSVNP